MAEQPAENPPARAAEQHCRGIGGAHRNGGGCSHNAYNCTHMRNGVNQPDFLRWGGRRASSGREMDGLSAICSYPVMRFETHCGANPRPARFGTQRVPILHRFGFVTHRVTNRGG